MALAPPKLVEGRDPGGGAAAAGLQPASARGELARYWPTLLGSTLGVAFGSAALPFYTAGLFMLQLQHEFGWTRPELTGVGLATTLLIAICAPLAGALFDRIGVRG